MSCLTKVHDGDPLDVFPVHIQGVGSTYQKRREEKRRENGEVRYLDLDSLDFPWTVMTVITAGEGCSAEGNVCGCISSRLRKDILLCHRQNRVNRSILS